MSIRAEPLESACDVGRSGNHVQSRHSSWTAWFAHCRGWVAIAILAPAAVVAGLSPLRYRPDTWGHFVCECVGWLLFTSGAVFRWWSTLHIGGRKSYELVSDGPYSITRNPIYLGTSLLTLSVAVLRKA